MRVVSINFYAYVSYTNPLDHKNLSNTNFLIIHQDKVLNLHQRTHYLNSTVGGKVKVELPSRLEDLPMDGHTDQKRKVSSPAPVTMELPSGDKAKYSTLREWPCSVAIFCILHEVVVFHTQIWFKEYPCVDTNSGNDLLYTSPHT